jgi:hypothetical protein
MQKKKSLTPYTFVQGTTHLDTLRKVNLTNRLRPRIIFIINKLMSGCWHHMDYRVRAMPDRNEFLYSKILIFCGFMI